MTSAETTAQISSRTEALDRRRLLRTAGIGGIGAFVAWLVQPFLVSIFSPLLPENGPDFAYVESMPFNGLMEAVVFGGIGVGLLFMVLAVARLAPASSTSARVGQTMGIVGAAVWLLVAGGSLATYTSVGWYLGKVAPDPAAQQALYQAMAIGTSGTLIAFALAMVGWLVMIATAGRRAGIIGWPLAIVALVAAAVTIGSYFFPFAPPWGSISAIGAALVFGIAFLVKARRSS